MHPIGIDELKGLFGLLDESGKIKKDKISFKSNNVFMKRCIRASIAELSTNEATCNEIIFHTSEKGEKGFELIKQGNKIISIRFLYRWKKTHLNQIEDAQTIQDLEQRQASARAFISSRANQTERRYLTMVTTKAHKT